MGSVLEARGVSCRIPLWSAEALLTAPEEVSALHRAYRDAGAEILTANTFRTQARTLKKVDHPGRARELTELAVELARRAGADAIVAGSIAPLEDCYEPSRAPADRALEREHREHAEHLAGAGCQLLLVETHNNHREALIATGAAMATGLPVVSSVVCDASAQLLSGESLDDTLQALIGAGVAAVGVNCLSLASARRCLPSLRGAGAPFLVSPNLAFETPSADTPFFAGAPDTVAEPGALVPEAAAWIAAGARIIGGCCGTTPEHIAALKRRYA